MDALWFHDVCDKHIRHLPKNIKAEKIQALYRDYWRLNHLLLRHYNVPNEPVKVVETPDKAIEIIAEKIKIHTKVNIEVYIRVSFLTSALYIRMHEIIRPIIIAEITIGP